MGYWRLRVDKRLDNPPSMVTRSLQWSETRLEEPAGELGVIKSVECDIFPQCIDTVGGRQEWHPAGETDRDRHIGLHTEKVWLCNCLCHRWHAMCSGVREKHDESSGGR